MIRDLRVLSREQWIVLTVFSLIPLWPLAQLAFGTTEYSYPTYSALLCTTTYPCAFLIVSGYRYDAAESVRKAMMWFGFVLSVIAILQNATSPGKVFWLFPTSGSEFVMGPIMYHSHWAAFVEVVIPFALYYGMEKAEWVYGLMVACLLGSVVASGSRGGIIVSSLETVAVIGLLVLRSRGIRYVGRAVFVLASATAVCCWIVGTGTLWKRFGEADPYGPRRSLLAPSLEMLGSHPFMGVGLGNWPVIYPKHARMDNGLFMNAAHCDWLQWACEGGVFFSGIFLIIAIVSLRQAYRQPWCAGVVAVFVHALADYPFSRPALACWIFSVLGLSFVKWPEQQERSGETRLTPT